MTLKQKISLSEEPLLNDVHALQTTVMVSLICFAYD
jgi:hypothetical protein